MTDTTKDEELIGLLPWYVNGTLSAQEQAEVEDFLARSEVAQAELKILQNLQQQVQSEWQEPAPGELGWKRLQKNLQSQDGQLGSNVIRLRSQSKWNRALAAAAVLVITLQVGVIWNNATTEQSTELLSGDSQAQQVSGDLFRIMLKADADWSEVVALLTDLNAEVVGGPTAMGMLTISLADKPADALQRLQDAEIIEHAQAVVHE